MAKRTASKRMSLAGTRVAGARERGGALRSSGRTGCTPLDCAEPVDARSMASARRGVVRPADDVDRDDVSITRDGVDGDVAHFAFLSASTTA